MLLIPEFHRNPMKWRKLLLKTSWIILALPKYRHHSLDYFDLFLSDLEAFDYSLRLTAQSYITNASNRIGNATAPANQTASEVGQMAQR